MRTILPRASIANLHGSDPLPDRPHHFTVDVEEYFHPTALAGVYPIDGWDALERRSPEVVPRLLDLLAESDTSGTFFVLGWLAEREPDMVRRIAERGHEVASHGYEHELVGRLGRDGFRESIGRSKAILEEITGAPVLGYRAPSFSIVPDVAWAFEELTRADYAYDASVFPISQHPTYGWPGASQDPYWIETPEGPLAEFPSTTASVLGRMLPASGGAYFRLLPYLLVKAGLGQASSRGACGMFYIHPWELDAWAPPVRGSRLQWVRTFWGRRGTWPGLRRLFGDFDFRRIDVTLAEMVEAGDGPGARGAAGPRR